MGPIGSYNSICLTGFGLLFVPLLQSSLWPGLIQLLTGTPGWTMDQVHCLPFQGLPKLPVTRSWSYLHRKSNTLGYAEVFFQSKGSASLIQGLKEKVNSSISLFDDSVVCPPGKVLLWVCDVGNPHSRFRLAADCPRWSSQCSSTYCADELSLYQQVGPTSLLPGWRLKEAKEWFLLDLKM